MTVQGLLGNARAARSNLEAAVAELQELEENLAQEKAKLEQEQAQVDADRQQVKKDQETLEVERAGLKEGKAVLEDGKAALEAEKTALEVEKAALKDGRAALEVEKAALKDERAALEVEKAALKDERAALEDRRAALEVEKAALEDEKAALEVEKATFKHEKATVVKNAASPKDLISLNFRGEKMVMMKRSVLCRIEGSLLEAMFNGRDEDSLEQDRDGNVYVGYPPAVMMPLMDWLTACQDVPPEEKLPAINTPMGYENIWKGAIKFFGLEAAVCPPVMFSGVMNNVKINALKGWDIALCKHCTENPTLADFKLPGISQDSAVLVGAKKAGTDELIVAAIGRLDVIAKAGNFNLQHNGVYWTWVSDEFFLFSDHPLGSFCASSNFAAAGVCQWAVGANETGVNSDEFEKIVMAPIGSNWSFDHLHMLKTQRLGGLASVQE